MAIKGSEDQNNFKLLLDKVIEVDNRIGQAISEMQNVKTMTMVACEYQNIMKEMMDLLEYMKKQHSSQMIEKQRSFAEQTSQFKNEIELLKTFADTKANEVDTLEETVSSQELGMGSLVKALKRSEEYITEKVLLL